MKEVHYQFFYSQIVRQGTNQFDGDKAVLQLNEVYNTQFEYTDELDKFVSNVINWLEDGNSPDYECIMDFV